MARLIIQIKTGGNRVHPIDRFGSNCGGTDGEVEVRLTSRDGQNGPWIILNNPGDDRERGSFDSYGFSYPFGILNARSLTMRFRAALSRPDDQISIDDWHLWFINLVEDNQGISRWEPDRCLIAPRSWQGVSFPIGSGFEGINTDSIDQNEIFDNFKESGIFVSLCDLNQIQDSKERTGLKNEDDLQPITNILTCSPFFQGTWSVEYLSEPEYSGQTIITSDGNNLNISGTINRNGVPDGDYTGRIFRCERNGEEHIAFYRYKLSSGHEGECELVLVAGTTDRIIGQYIDNGNGDRGVIEMWKLGSERFSRRTADGFFAHSAKRAEKE